ncbi:hypothetical protein F66182_3584 [Fusarium sp. NRRL 66182]|nr:hypothetical protein F66182_3584 [Fusarium sp. NRRL 66182]
MLRICDARRRFVWTLWGVIAIMIITALIFILAIANVCYPIMTLWAETTHGTCNPRLDSTIGFFFSAVSILTDWTLAILLGILLWNIQIKPRVKLSVGLMLGLAVFLTTSAQFAHVPPHYQPEQHRLEPSVCSYEAIGVLATQKDGQFVSETRFDP